MEFALVAPFAIALMIGVYDLARAYIVWQQTCGAAQAIAEAAEKLSYTPGSPVTQLTWTQMQAAMSTAYAEISGLSLGDGVSTASSAFSVTLSEVVYTPTCQTSSGCSAQTPHVYWSTALAQTGVSVPTPALRACGALTAVATFPDDSTQLTKMVSWTPGPVLAPQVVADVHTIFVPTFSMFIGPVTFWSSAAMPTPIGGTDQAIAYNNDNTAPTGSVQTCTLP